MQEFATGKFHVVLPDHFAEINSGAALIATLITSICFPNARRPIGTNAAAYEKNSAPPGSSINMLPQRRVDAEGGPTSGRARSCRFWMSALAPLLKARGDVLAEIAQGMSMIDSDLTAISAFGAL